MTVPSNSTPVKQALAFTKLEGVLKGALGDLRKSLDEGALRDVEKIESVTDGHGREGVPSVPTGAPMTMRGGAAATEVSAHITPAPQGGNTADYEALARQLSDIGKSLGAHGASIESLQKGASALATTLTGLIGALEKAGEDDEKDEDKDEVTKSLRRAVRKASLAVVKAEDEDEEDADTVEKATDAVKALGTAVEKAENDAEDDDKEKAAEKARGEFRDLRTRLKKASEKRAAAKAAPATPAAEAPAAAAAPSVDEQVRKALEPVAAALGRKVDDLAGLLSGASRAPASPPEFAKAVQGAAVEDISARLDDLFDEGGLEIHEISKAKSTLSRLAMAQSGHGDIANVAREIELMPDAVRAIFTPATA